MSENKKSLYILFLSDALDLMLNDVPNNLISRTETMDRKHLQKFSGNLTASTAEAIIPPKYDNTKITRPDVTPTMCKKFIILVD